MLPQQKKGWTTMVDLDEFERTTWSYLGNVKELRRYRGIANLFRHEGIALYGKDLGTMKMNHPIMCMAIPQSKDKNYGVDLYVPASDKKRAARLFADDELLERHAQLEETEGEAACARFDAEARAAKEQRAIARRERRAGKAGALASLFARKASRTPRTPSASRTSA